MTKRRLAILGVLVGVNGLLSAEVPARAAEEGSCSSCYKTSEGTFCGDFWNTGYSSCGGGGGIPCVNGPYDCPLDN